MNGLLLTTLPGPDRKRTDSLYRYRIVYRNPEPDDLGCLMVWAVEGGRDEYQVALERDQSGELHWHCTCADAVYRAETRANHQCKHVRGLTACWPPAQECRRSA